MKQIFVDTVAWLALLNRRDRLHETAVKQMAILQSQSANLITTEFILLEVADALSAPAFRTKTVQFINSLSTMSFLTIVPIEQNLYQAGWALYGERMDKDWGLTDCTSFVVMQELNIEIAFSSDRHFVQAGFQNLL